MGDLSCKWSGKFSLARWYLSKDLKTVRKKQYSHLGGEHQAERLGRSKTLSGQPAKGT